MNKYSNTLIGLAFLPAASVETITSGSYRNAIFSPTVSVTIRDVGTKSFALKESAPVKFKRLVKQWKSETGHLSVIQKRYKHEAYKAILAMKKQAIPLILEELKRDPDRWFDALEHLTAEDPAANADTFYEAVDKWIAWGVAHEYIECVTV